MSRNISRLWSLAAGLAGALVLLTLTHRDGQAMKEGTLCYNGTESLCKTVERCDPSGFDSVGKCKWIYSIQRFYWR